MPETILLNNFKKQWEDIGPDVEAAVRRVGESGWYVLGSEVSGFEQALAGAWGLSHAVGVANGLDAIEIGLRALGLQPGEKVLTTPLSAFATTLAILRAGGVPVFVDTDAHGLLDLNQAEEVLASGKIRFMVPVHLYGHSMSLDRLDALKAKYGLRIVEDCAQAIGARWNGCPVGTVGQVAATSFYPTKNLGAMGDGGALLTDDAGLYEKARCLRDYGQTEKYVHGELGLNSRLDELQAALLRSAMLPRLPEWTARRREIAARYRAEIANEAIDLPEAPTGSESVWHLFPILARDERDGLMAHLKAQDVLSAVHYPRLIPDQPALRSGGETPRVLGSLENARRFADFELSLPIHPYLTGEEIDRVIAACNSWKPACRPALTR